MWPICLSPKHFFASGRNMFRNNLWHFHSHRLKAPISIPQFIHKCPFTSGSFSVLLPFHSNRLKGALEVIFMAPSQVQKASVKTEANCWKRSFLLSSADTWTGEQVPYQWKQKAQGQNQHAASLVLYPGQVGAQPCCWWEREKGRGREEERVFALAEADFFFFFNRIRLGGTGRHTRFYWRKVCWLLKFRASFLMTNLSKWNYYS